MELVFFFANGSVEHSVLSLFSIQVSFFVSTLTQEIKE